MKSHTRHGGERGKTSHRAAGCATPRRRQRRSRKIELTARGGSPRGLDGLYVADACAASFRAGRRRSRSRPRGARISRRGSPLQRSPRHVGLRRGGERTLRSARAADASPARAEGVLVADRPEGCFFSVWARGRGRGLDAARHPAGPSVSASRAAGVDASSSFDRSGRIRTLTCPARGRQRSAERGLRRRGERFSHREARRAVRAARGGRRLGVTRRHPAALSLRLRLLLPRLSLPRVPA